MTRPIAWAGGVFVALALTASIAGDRLAGLAARQPTVAATVAPRPATPAFEPVVTVQADGQGHYLVRPTVDGATVPMLVDTGASLVVLRHEDALALGIRPSRSAFTGRTHTANGVTTFAPMRLREMRLNGILVRDVDAAVMGPGQLGTSLLGMSFLRQLRGFDISRGRLTLRG